MASCDRCNDTKVQSGIGNRDVECGCPEVALGILDSATKCSDHPCSLDKDLIEQSRCAASWCACGTEGGCGRYCDSEGVALFLLKDGRYAVAEESSDSSGHG